MFFTKHILPHCTTLCVTLPFRDRHKPFHRNLDSAKHHHQECTHHWPFDRIAHLLLHPDRGSTEMCSLQLLCPRSFTPDETASDCSLHQDQNFPEQVSLRNCHRCVPNRHAKQPTSSQHSIHHNSSQHQTKNCQC